MTLQLMSDDRTLDRLSALSYPQTPAGASTVERYRFHKYVAIHKTDNGEKLASLQRVHNGVGHVHADDLADQNNCFVGM
jgi:hypothetical protein